MINQVSGLKIFFVNNKRNIYSISCTSLLIIFSELFIWHYKTQDPKKRTINKKSDPENQESNNSSQENNSSTDQINDNKPTENNSMAISEYVDNIDEIFYDNKNNQKNQNKEIEINDCNNKPQENIQENITIERKKETKQQKECLLSFIQAKKELESQIENIVKGYEMDKKYNQSNIIIWFFTNIDKNKKKSLIKSLSDFSDTEKNLLSDNINNITNQTYDKSQINLTETKIIQWYTIIYDLKDDMRMFKIGENFHSIQLFHIFEKEIIYKYNQDNKKNLQTIYNIPITKKQQPPKQ